MLVMNYHPSLRFNRNQDIFNSFFDDVFSKDEKREEVFNPRFEISTKDNKTTIEMELPGVKKEDVKIVLENGLLTVSGEKKLAEEKKEADYYHSKRYYGSFKRSFKVYKNITDENIEAKYNDGVLAISFSKPEEQKPVEKSIEIK